MRLHTLWQRAVRARRLRDAETCIAGHARAITSSASLSWSAVSASSSSASAAAAAAAAVFDAFGEPSDVLRVRDLPLPRLGAGQVLLELEAAPINPSDVNTIQGRYPLRPEPPNAVPGHEGVFRVAESADDNLPPGARVVPLRPALGTWRSAGVFDARDWHRVPAELPLAAAATLCVNPPTALALLEDFVDVSPGAAGGDERAVVVQTGATSAVGQLVAQLARHRGARTVNIVRDRPDWDETRAWLESLGGDLVTTEARARADAKKLGLPPAALALDCVGGGVSGVAARLLRPGGTLVCYGAMSLQPVQVPASLLIFKDVRVRGFWLSGRRRRRRRPTTRTTGREEERVGKGVDNDDDDDDEEGEEDLRARRELLDRAAALFLSGAWRPPPTVEVPLCEAARGVAMSREGRTRHKVVLVPSS